MEKRRRVGHFLFNEDPFPYLQDTDCKGNLLLDDEGLSLDNAIRGPSSLSLF